MIHPLTVIQRSDLYYDLNKPSTNVSQLGNLKQRLDIFADITEIFFLCVCADIIELQLFFFFLQYDNGIITVYFKRVLAFHRYKLK